jgi:hypothetical protein
MCARGSSRCGPLRSCRSAAPAEEHSLARGCHRWWCLLRRVPPAHALAMAGRPSPAVEPDRTAVVRTPVVPVARYRAGYMPRRLPLPVCPLVRRYIAARLPSRLPTRSCPRQPTRLPLGASSSWRLVERRAPARFRTCNRTGGLLRVAGRCPPQSPALRSRPGQPGAWCRQVPHRDHRSSLGSPPEEVGSWGDNPF